MFKIGEFSKLSQVSVKTLRYYDNIGLFQPDEVDRWTGYRYYSPRQLPRLHRILALKDLGLSLEQIDAILSNEISIQELRGMLRLKQAELAQQVEFEQARLARIEARLRQLEQEGIMPTRDVTIKEIPATKVISIRDIMPNYASVGPLWHEMGEYMKAQGVQPAGPCLAVFYDTEYKESDVDVEACWPISGETKPADRVQVRELPGGTMASMILEGSYDGFTAAYGVLMTWIMENGYHIVGPNREIYIIGPGMGHKPSEFVSEIQFPVVKA
ncbi:MAG: MerR family transcriptional regulator [Caldilineales bacterium]|nr:MerR family transcriptional regulator [Caldilineales bacterium]